MPEREALQLPVALPAPYAPAAFPYYRPEVGLVNVELQAQAPVHARRAKASVLRKELRSGSTKATAIYKLDKHGNPRLVFALDRYTYPVAASAAGKHPPRRRQSSVLEIITLVDGQLRFAHVDKTYGGPGAPSETGSLITAMHPAQAAQAQHSHAPISFCPLRGHIPVVDRGAAPRCKLNAALWKFYQAVGLETVKEASKCYRAAWNEASSLMEPQPARGWVLLANMLKCPELVPALRRVRLAGGKTPKALFMSCRWTASSLRRYAAWIQKNGVAYVWFYEPESARIALGTAVWRYIQAAPTMKARTSHTAQPVTRHRSNDLQSAQAGITEKQVRALTRMKRWRLVQWLLQDHGHPAISEPLAKLTWRMLLRIDQTATSGAVDISGVAGLANAVLDAGACSEQAGLRRLGKLLLHESKVSWNALWSLCGVFRQRHYSYIGNAVIREMMHERAGTYLIVDTARMLVQLQYPANRQEDWPRPQSCAALQKLHDDCMAKIDAEAAVLEQTPYDISGWVPGTDEKDFCIEPLGSPAEVRAEGGLMHHCVAAYRMDPSRGDAALYRLLRPERATVMLNKGWHANPADQPWQLAQAYGVCNAALKPETLWMIRYWVENRLK